LIVVLFPGAEVSAGVADLLSADVLVPPHPDIRPVIITMDSKMLVLFFRFLTIFPPF
jgi:hypothetical protein